MKPEPIASEPIAARSARKLPVWVMGLAITPMGFLYGFTTTAMGILLAARGVSLGRIANVSVIASSPTFWGFVLSPVVDVRFSKRSYAIGLALLGGASLGGALLCLNHLALFTALALLATLSGVLYAAAVGGWQADVLREDREADTMGGWSNVANLGAAGMFTLIVVVLVRHLRIGLAAAAIALVVVAPSMLVLFFPDPPKPESSLKANFEAMGRDLIKVLRGGRVWVGLALFLSPICFALCNLFSSFGSAYGASERMVTTLNGPLVAVVCSTGCLLSILLCQRFSRVKVYLSAGLTGAVCAIALALLPHTPHIYAGGLLAYNFAQGLNYTAFYALALEITGPGNALAGTMMCVFASSANLPLEEMTWVDGRAWTHGGLRAMFFVDAGATVAAVFGLYYLVLPWIRRWAARREARFQAQLECAVVQPVEIG